MNYALLKYYTDPNEHVKLALIAQIVAVAILIHVRLSHLIFVGPAMTIRIRHVVQTLTALEMGLAGLVNPSDTVLMVI